jgi:hypothetical protein
MLGGQPGQLRFGMLAGFDVDEAGQPVPKAADYPYMVDADGPGTLGGGGAGQHRLQGLPGDRLAFAEISGLVDAARRLGAGDP